MPLLKVDLIRGLKYDVAKDSWSYRTLGFPLYKAPHTPWRNNKSSSSREDHQQEEKNLRAPQIFRA
jgi:hypothetical protein